MEEGRTHKSNWFTFNWLREKLPLHHFDMEILKGTQRNNKIPNQPRQCWSSPRGPAAPKAAAGGLTQQPGKLP